MMIPPIEMQPSRSDRLEKMSRNSFSLSRKMIANHFLQREKALEWHSVVGNLL